MNEDFDADEILREPDDYIEEETDEDEVPELDLGNPSKIYDLDISDEDTEDNYLG